MERILFHIDVNSAFLSWSAVRMLREGANTDIREIPAIIGGDKEQRHGIVLAKSIPAKKYGIVTGEPVVDAYRKCPELVSVPPDHGYYSEQSRKLMELLKEYTPDIEQVSIDECYMDFTGIRKNFESPLEAAHIIKDKVKKECGFTVNIGISSRKVLAKMASDFTKPDKVHTLFPEEIEEKMWPLPVGELFMAGHSSVETLHKLGIFTIGQLAQTPVNILESHLKSHGRTLWEYANGIDDTWINKEKEALKGIGNSVTLPRDYDKIEDINKVLLQLSEKVGGRLRKAEQKAKTVAVEIKYSNFVKVSRQTSLYNYTDVDTEIYETVKTLFDEVWNKEPVRLLGVRTANLADKDEPEQMSMFDIMEERADNNQVSPSRDKLKKLDKALDSIKAKYGDDVVSRASLLKKE